MKAREAAERAGPCPACGAKVSVTITDRDGSWIYCENCGRNSGSFDDLEDALMWWNSTPRNDANMLCRIADLMILESDTKLEVYSIGAEKWFAHILSNGFELCEQVSVSPISALYMLNAEADEYLTENFDQE